LKLIPPFPLKKDTKTILFVKLEKVKNFFLLVFGSTEVSCVVLKLSSDLLKKIFIMLTNAYLKTFAKYAQYVE
jgi:hypothetical protein